MAAPKGFPKNPKYEGEVGKQRNVLYRAPPVPDQESPQKLGDRDNLRDYDGTVKLGGWLRGSDATKAPFFRKTKV